MYSEMQQQLRMSLAQFFGAILTNSHYEDSEYKKQSLVALAIEELLKVCKTEENQIDMIAAKPILKGTHYLLEQRKNDIISNLKETSLSDKDINKAVEDLHSVILNLNQYIETIK